ncbi:MAG: ATP-dependent helicase [Planctomycetota bacterium]|jgi:superfamily I DNA/RNA helicase
MAAKVRLNKQQEKAVKTIKGPVLVLAGAGTGKTSVVTGRIAHLLKSGAAKPEQITAVTFTNKAAAEMRERVAKKCGKSATSGLIISTFHSLCVKILRRDAAVLGFRENFSILDTGSQLTLIRKGMREVNGIDKMKPDDIQYEISKCKSRGISRDAYQRSAIEDREYAVAAVYRKYQEGLRVTNSMDFDDLLINAVQVLEKDEKALKFWQKRSKFLMVDEFQDTNDIQFKMLKLLSKKTSNLCVVGDDDQSIYSWRGAMPKHIINFDKTFKNTTVIRLEENYRSVNSILKASNALIAANEDRVGKTLWSGKGEGDPIYLIEAEDNQEEAERVVGRIKRSISEGRRSQDHAILFRTNGQTRAYEAELRANHMQYVVIGGQSFFDFKEVKDIMSYLAVVANPRDENSLLRIINTPARSLGNKSIEQLTSFSIREKVTILDSLGRADEIEELTKGAKAGAKQLYSIFDKCIKQVKKKKTDQLVDNIIKETGYIREVEHLYDDAMDVSARINMAYEVDDSLKEYLSKNKSAKLHDFLQEASLFSKEEDKDKDKKVEADAIKLITLHSAKGLEFPHVYLIGMQEGLIPHKNSMEFDDVSEERRLAYVGLTRAQETLTLSYAKSRSFRGKTTEMKPSRFLAEIPEELLDKRDKKVKKDEVRSKIKSIMKALE